MTIDSRSVSCTWIHWCPIVYPLSVISFVFEDTFWWTKGNQKDISRCAWQLFGFYIICVITIMIENYTMGPNSTSLFILTLRESYKLSDSRVILTCCCLQFWVPHFLHTGARVMSKDMRVRSVLKNLRKAHRRYFYFYFYFVKTNSLQLFFDFLFLIWNDCAFINSLQAGASETA